MSENIVAPISIVPEGMNNQLSTSSPAIPTPVVPPPKKFPLFLAFLLILLTTLAVISVYLFIQVRTLTLEKNSPSPTPTPVATSDPNAGWQTYTNTKYSYTLKIPKDWKISSSEPGPGEIPLNNSSRGLVMYPDSFSNSASARTNITLEIDGVENLTYKTYEDWLTATETPFFNLIKREEIDFHGVKTRLMSGNYDGYGYPAKITVRSFPSRDKKNYFSITTTEPAEENIDHNIIDQILSTFKFTEQSFQKYSIKEIEEACILLQGSTKYWNSKYNECMESGTPQGQLEIFCTQYGGTFFPNSSTCRHAQEEGITCGPEATYYCGFSN